MLIFEADQFTVFNSGGRIVADTCLHVLMLCGDSFASLFTECLNSIYLLTMCGKAFKNPLPQSQRLEMFHNHPHSRQLTDRFTAAFSLYLIQTLVTILQLEMQTPVPWSLRHLKTKFLLQRALAGGSTAGCHKVSCSRVVGKGNSKVSLNRH